MHSLSPTLNKAVFNTILLFGVTLSLFLLSSLSSSAQTLFETLSQQNEKGFSYIQYKGEQTLKGKEILNIIEQQGCTLRVLWIPEQGIGYHTEAIGVADFVNKPFFEKALLKKDTKITIQCRDNTRLNQSIQLEEPEIQKKEITETSIAIQWNTIQHTKEYRVTYCENKETNLCKQETTQNTEYTIENLKQETPYTITVHAIASTRDYTNSEKSNTLTLQTKKEKEQIIQDITETHIHWFQYPKINTERNKQGEALIQYGGGSLYHLVGRLSTQGCNVHTLEIEDKETQRVYEYSFQNTNEQNQEFTDKYKEYIPNNTIIGISCIDNCDVIYGLDLVESEAGQYWEKCQDQDITRYDYINETLVSRSLCEDNWSDKAREFFPNVPAYQDTCKIDVIVKTFTFSGVSLSGILIDRKAMYQLYVPKIVLFQHKDPQQQKTDMQLLRTEIHELCHIHQNWYTFKEYIDYNYLRDNAGIDEQVFVNKLWIQTPMAQAFNEIVGFTQRDDGTWKLRTDNPYRGIYGTGNRYRDFSSSPKELSADLCTYYLLQEIQPNSEFKQFAQDPYITEEIKEWIETYIVLPE